MAAVTRAGLNIQLQGYTPANRDATVRLVHEATGQVVERKPFLDGSLTVRDLEPGFYQLQVSHPNLINLIDNRRIRVFPQPAPTFVPVNIPADLFRDSPIRDIPDADLAPVQNTAQAVRQQVQPLAAKGPGEAIRASDWNALVDAVGDLATAVLELTNLVSPKGHDHPEIAEKINEVQGNILRFSEAFGRSLVQLQREIETQHLGQTVDNVLDLAGATTDLRDRLTQRVDVLRDAIQTDTPNFTQKLSNAGSVILTTVNELAEARGPDADNFRAQPEVQKLVNVAQTYFNTGTQTRPETELQTYMQSSAKMGGTKLTDIFKGG
jgi:hypothetical protein